MKTHEQITQKRFNDLKPYYDATWDPKEHTLHVGLFNKKHSSLVHAYTSATAHLINKLNNMRPITSSSTILDIGCGAGRTLVSLCEKYQASGVGVDLSDEMIKDAKLYLKQINYQRASHDLPNLKIKFVRGSGSELGDLITKKEQFTHIISQDAILLMQNKQAVFENIYRLLVPNGAVAIADFLSEKPQENLNKDVKEAIYSFVNWTSGLSYDQYVGILQSYGLINITSEKRNQDMATTYSLLIRQAQKHPRHNEQTIRDLINRYEHIVAGVNNGTMGWGLFWAKKPEPKRALIAGANPKSIGRYIAQHLHEQGWEIWLYGLHNKPKDANLWHERRCDISKETKVKKLLKETPGLDLVLFTADTGGHGELETLTENKIVPVIKAKLIGSVLLARLLLQKYGAKQKPMQWVWIAGKTLGKSKNLMLYNMINNGLWGFVDGLNIHYAKVAEAYYLPTTLTSPSTLGDEFIEAHGRKLLKIAQHPQKLLEQVIRIIEHKEKPGMIEPKQDVL